MVAVPGQTKCLVSPLCSCDEEQSVMLLPRLVPPVASKTVPTES